MEPESVGVLGKSVDFITYSCRWMTESRTIPDFCEICCVIELYLVIEV